MGEPERNLWYLVGPMTACYYEAQNWRNHAKQFLGCIDPYEEEAEIKAPLPHKNLFEYYKSLRGAHEFDRIRKEFHVILDVNNASVDRAFGVLAYEPYPQDISSWGTIKEVVRAYEQDKPVVMWSEVPNEKMNFTMICMSRVIVPTLTEAIQACKNIEQGAL